LYGAVILEKLVLAEMVKKFTAFTKDADGLLFEPMNPFDTVSLRFA
jgi:hypothetical protein